MVVYSEPSLRDSYQADASDPGSCIGRPFGLWDVLPRLYAMNGAALIVLQHPNDAALRPYHQETVNVREAFSGRPTEATLQYKRNTSANEAKLITQWDPRDDRIIASQT